MTSQHPEGIALEQKAQPVPSSDKMALDLDIHGTSYRDDTNHDSVSPDASLNPPLDMSSPQYTSSTTPAVNGHTNTDARSVNAAVEVKTGELHAEPLKGDYTASVENLRLSQTSDTVENSTASDLLPPVDSAAVESSFEDLGTSTSTVPPVIETQESDMRDVAYSSDRTGAKHDPLDLSAETEVPEPVSSDARTNSQDLDLNLNSSPAVSAPPSTTTTLKTESTTNASLPQTNNLPASNMEQKDAEMVDAPAPSSTSKISREREDDNEIEPLAKRTKTEDLEAATTQLPNNGTPVQNGEPTTAATDSSPILPHQTKEISRVIRNVLKTTSGKNFRAPVSVLWPGFAEAYLQKTPNPIDLSTIDKKVKAGEYATMKDFRDDVWLLYKNCLAFNGPEHTITKTAEEVRDTILSRTADLPPEPPTAAPKAAKKQPKRSTPAVEPPAGPTSPRRASRGSGPSPAAPKSETFALDPSTSTPLIRRDSTKIEGGRPKREIHPPKNKDLTYSVRPKSKKFATELRFCEEVLNEMKKAKYSVFSAPFMIPVDPVALGIPNYFKVIKTPMDVSKVSEKLQNGHYAKAKDFETDIKLIFANCYKFNPPGNPVRDMGKAFEEVFDREWAKRDKWILDHTPAAPSPSSIVETDEEESEQEEEQEQPAATTGTTPAALRLIEEQNKLIKLMTAKKPDQALIQMQQDLVEIVQKRVMEETQTAPKKAKKGKPASSKPTKKGPPTKKGAAILSKKQGGQRQKYLGTLEKEVISAGLGSLSDEVSDVVLGLIKGDQPGVDVGDDGTLELDIDLVTTPTLWKIYDLIMRHAPEVEAMVKKQMQEKEAPRALAKPPPKKKNKPMSKVEQERKIEHLKNSVQEFERHGSGSQEPVMPTVEHHEDESSGDDDSSDSEEE
ncbi:hypothetical protein B7463_g6572, partial [Scytalidium lignicola]